MAGRGRKPIVIDQRELQAIVDTIEASGPCANRTELWKLVEETEWARNLSRPLTAQVAMLKAKELGITMKTPLGLRGRVKGSGPINVGKGGRKKKVFSPESRAALINGIPGDSLDNQRAKLQKTIDKACSGSMKAAVKLKCLDCCGWEKMEVAQCQAKECSLYNFRPYKRPSVVTSLDVVDVSPEPSPTRFIPV